MPKTIDHPLAPAQHAAMEIMKLNWSPPSAGWFTSVMTQLRQSSDDSIRRRFESWGQDKISDYAQSLATKMVVAGVAARRLDAAVRQVIAEAAKVPDDQLHLYIETVSNNPLAPRERKYVVPLPFRGTRAEQDALAYGLVLDIDAFVFEARSLYEMLVDYLREFSHRILGRATSKEELTSALEARRAPTTWVSSLNGLRNTLIHNRSPWIAIEVTSRTPLRFDILLDMKNPGAVESDFIRFQRIREIYQGVQDSLPALREYLLSQIPPPSVVVP